MRRRPEVPLRERDGWVERVERMERVIARCAAPLRRVRGFARRPGPVPERRPGGRTVESGARAAGAAFADAEG
ncbi:hypothetical protein ACFZAD_24015 [Streptomyces iakyrus]|uniref:hypothetical protein n=1 Tax=Streptomyces iakyrus TaxID=68219 RepID=UPI0036E6981B